MSRETLVYRPNHPQCNENGMVPVSIAGPRIEKADAFYVISDTLPRQMKHPGTGEMIDSKSRFRQATRASGCVEVGTDPSASKPRPRFEVSEREIAMDVKRSIAELNSR
jgi:hypothetical protein